MTAIGRRPRRRPAAATRPPLEPRLHQLGVVVDTDERLAGRSLTDVVERHPERLGHRPVQEDDEHGQRRRQQHPGGDLLTAEAALVELVDGSLADGRGPGPAPSRSSRRSRAPARHRRRTRARPAHGRRPARPGSNVQDRSGRITTSGPTRPQHGTDGRRRPMHRSRPDARVERRRTAPPTMVSTSSGAITG